MHCFPPCRKSATLADVTLALAHHTAARSTAGCELPPTGTRSPEARKLCPPRGSQKMRRGSRRLSASWHRRRDLA
jgi:hypothetical protein